MNYSKAFTFMFFMTLFISVVTTLYTYFLVSILDPEMIDRIREQAAEKIYEQGNIPDDQIDKIIEMQSAWINPLVMTISAFFGNLFFGTILSLIVAIFVKKEVQIFED